MTDITPETMTNDDLARFVAGSAEGRTDWAIRLRREAGRRLALLSEIGPQS
jgi:hypothetical protein